MRFDTVIAKTWDCRLVSRFLLWPLKIRGERRWMEHAMIVEFYSEVGHCWVARQWADGIDDIPTGIRHELEMKDVTTRGSKRRVFVDKYGVQWQ